MGLKIIKEEYTNKTFRIEKQLLSEMEKICGEKGISLNKLVSICIQYAIDNLEQDEQQDKE